MKTSYLFSLIVLAVLTSIFISTMSSPSEYSDFAKAASAPEKEFTVIGKLNKDKNIEYNPARDPNISVFYMIDQNGKEFKVILNQSKPQDIEKSEDVVIKGKADGNTFYAHTILLKCPSKYEEQNNFTYQQ
jgi:cytochrome c-type biogenesis protein CcmE